MNIIKAKLKEVQQSKDLLIIKLEVESEIFSILAINSVNFIKELQNAENIEMLFKEHELFFANNKASLSVENSFLAKIKSIEKGDLLWQICFEYKNFTLFSMICAKFGKKLNLQIDDEKMCFIKASDITLRLNNA